MQTERLEKEDMSVNYFTLKQSQVATQKKLGQHIKIYLVLDLFKAKGMRNNLGYFFFYRHHFVFGTFKCKVIDCLNSIKPLTIQAANREVQIRARSYPKYIKTNISAYVFLLLNI